ncbi:ATP-binding protein [Streptomyces sp. 3MP-14]|uniref:ATP-binding protein n=1 Tax=Streptomyces mimosae TaxID=2586635 RepID=A0A5N5ZKS6_9ACTN|nr:MULTISPECIES: ATP-binding protein [Streptomyces]KAB8157091.1 ATP-binding protein [Streptomyces mimosae]KAB8172714.1 ATP-binding protein [Streptomyces sp. 3MP-14]
MTSPEMRGTPRLVAPPPAVREPAVLSGSYRFRSIALVADYPDTPAAARHTARHVLGEWGLAGLADDVELCVSELVGNAIHHATPDGRRVQLAGERRVVVAFRYWPRSLFVEVSDEDSTPPTLPAGDPVDPSTGSEDALLAEGGRGLFIVQSLADATWWAPADQGGKSVFCRFDLAEERERSAETRFTSGS